MEGGERAGYGAMAGEEGGYGRLVGSFAGMSVCGWHCGGRFLVGGSC